MAQAKAAQLQLLSVQSRLHDLALALSLSPPGGSPELTQVCLCARLCMCVCVHKRRTSFCA